MIYFASDVHLGCGTREEQRASEKRFVAWLDGVQKDADAIILVGDVFDFWFEYHRVVPKGFVRTFGKIAELSDRGIRMVFFTGNHDMWVKDYFEKELGMEVYTSPKIMQLNGREVFVAHGDNLNIQDKPLLRLMNGVFRSKGLKWLFSWLVHPDWALKFGQWWSGSSRKKHNMEELGEGVTESLVRYAHEKARQNPKIDHFIFGHMHYPRETRLEGVHVINMGGWEKFPSYAVMDDKGELTLKML